MGFFRLFSGVVLTILALISFVESAFGAQYTINNNPPPGCSANGGTVTCPNGLTLQWDDVITVNGNNRVLNIQGDANLQNAQINVGEDASRLTVNITGNLTTNTGFSINAPLNVQGNINSGSQNTFTSPVSAGSVTTNSDSIFAGITSSGSVQLGSNNRVNGNISGISVQTGSSTVITGSITASTLLTGSGTQIQGNVILTGSYSGGSDVVIEGALTATIINTGSNTAVGGPITGTTVTIGSANNISGTIIGNSISIQSSNSIVNGALNSNTSVSIGSGAIINGPVSGTNITTISPVTINGNVSASGAFTLESGSSVTGNVTASNVTIRPSNSDITGDVTATQTIDIGSGSGITGNANADTITLNYSNAYITEDATADTVITNNEGSIGGNATAPTIINNNGSVGGSAICDDSTGQTPHTCTTGPIDDDDDDNDGGPPGSCDAISGLSEVGIIGDTNFEFKNNSKINGNTISGSGNTPTPTGSVTTVPTEFPLFEPLIFPSDLVGGPDRTNQTNIPPGSYDEIKSNGDDAFTSFAGGGTYYIEKLEIDGRDAVIQFAPGDYFIEEIDLDNRSYLTVFPEGLVRIFIKDKFKGQNNIFINSGGSPANLIIYLYDGAEVDVGNYNEGSGVLNFSGSIYSPFEDTEIKFGNNNNIEGSILSAGEVKVGSNTNFTYTTETQQAILEAYGCDPDAAEIHHYRIRHTLGIVSCFTAVVSVDACADASCSTLFEDPVEISLNSSAAQSEWSGGDLVSATNTTGTFSLTNGTGFIGLQNVPGGAASLTIDNATVAATNATQCFDPTGATPSSCTVDFQTAGLLFVGPSNFEAIPHSHAGVDFPVALRAIQTNVNTGACEARVEGPQIVDIGIECVNPVTCVADQSYTVNGTSVGLNNSGSSANKQSVSLTFDSNGIALVPHNYSDVGELRLHAELSLPAEANADNPDVDDPPVVLNGSSLNEFVVKPHTLLLQALDSANNIWSSTTNTGNGFQAAGSPFNVIIQSQNANGDPTPNFGNEISPAGVLAVFDSVAFPSGGESGTVTVANAFIPDNSYVGAMRSNGVTWSEAGTVNLRAGLVGNSYLGAGDALNKPPSPVGRFFPDRFVVSDSFVFNSYATVFNSCATEEFSYMDHNNIQVSAEIRAVNVHGDVTTNYGKTANNGPNYVGSAAANLVAASDNPQDTANDEFATRFVAAVAPAWNDGVMAVTLDNLTFARLSSNAPDGPFPVVTIGMQLSGEQDNRNFAAFNLSSQSGDAVALNGSLDIRYGRMVLENITGPSNEDLAIDLRAQYWNGNQFITNTDDNCTEFWVDNLNIINNPDILNTTADGTDGELVSGRVPFSELFWRAPAPTDTTGEFEFEYEAPPWLQFDWFDADSFPHDNPRAFGTFGQYRGNDRIIFWLELR